MKIEYRKKLSSGFLNLEEITYKTSDDKIIKREIDHRGDAVTALVYDTKKCQFIFVRQFRPGANCDLTEIVAGTMDVEEESPENCMKREIMEEIGYEVDKIEQIFSGFSSPGSLTEKMYIFYAEVSEKTEEGGGIGDENLQIIEISEKALDEHFFSDLKTIVAIQWYKKRKAYRSMLQK